MRVAKWGNSLAVRLPKEVVDHLRIKEGDELQMRREGNVVTLVPCDRRAQAMEALRRISRPGPPGFKFDRLEVNERPDGK